VAGRVIATRARSLQGKRLGWSLILPLLVVMVLIMAFPFAFLAYVSLTDWTAAGGDWWEADVIGFSNFGDAITDGRFLKAVGRTWLFAAIAVGAETLLGLGLALIVAERLRGHRVFTIAFLLPMMVIPAVSGFLFFMMFQTSGPANGFLSLIWPGEASISWLADAKLAFGTAILADVWQWTPLMFLIFLSGVLAVPPNMHDAAMALGASSWQRLRYVVLPLLKKVLIVAIIIRGIEALKIFDVIFLLTKGGPGHSTETVSTYLYEVGFREFRFAYSTAVALIVLVMVILTALPAVNYLQKAEEAA
jgi:multiple sugar transport system permease protein